MQKSGVGYRQKKDKRNWSIEHGLGKTKTKAVPRVRGKIAVFCAVRLPCRSEYILMNMNYSLYFVESHRSGKPETVTTDVTPNIRSMSHVPHEETTPEEK